MDAFKKNQQNNFLKKKCDFDKYYTQQIVKMAF